MTYAEIKAIVKQLNDLQLKGIEPVRMIGVKGEMMVEKFLSTVDAIDDAGFTDQLPENIVAAYNDLVAATEAGGTGIDGPPEKPVKEKKEKPVKEKKEKGPGRGTSLHVSKPRSRYDHIQSALSGQLDDLLYEGNTVAYIVEKLDIKRTRVINHIKHLRNDLGLTVVETKPADKDAKLNDTHYKVTEEAWSKN